MRRRRLALPSMPRRHLPVHALHRDRKVAGRAGPVGGVHARRAVKRIDHYSRVVRKCGQPAPLRRKLRLDPRVAFERRLRLVWDPEPEIAGRDGVETIRCDELVDLPYLAWVVASDDQAIAAPQSPRHAMPQMRGSANSIALPAGSRK